MSIFNKTIIGYFHVCQKEGWERSFDIIFSEIKKSGLYDRTSEIRVGIVNDLGSLIDNSRFHDSKIKIILIANSNEYERPTLLHMRVHADIDNVNTCYYYVHTKGITHWGKSNESFIVDWINFLLYFNITKWKFALSVLEFMDTYGCNAIHKQHYSGNFWWSNSSHLKKLNVYIPDYYTAPEDYICTVNDKMFNIFSSGLQGMGHYSNPYPSENYLIPDDFDLDAYYTINSDLHHLSYEDLIYHYLKWGKYEGKNYKLDHDFEPDNYRLLNPDINHFTRKDLVWHWYHWGKNENRPYKLN